MTSEERTIHSQGSSGKFFARNLPLESLEFLKLKLALYSISWLLKMLGWALIMKVKKEGGFSKTSLMLIHVFQKIHIVTFNLVALDQVMYGLRHLFQSRGLPLWKSGINIVLTVALCYDFVEFWYLASKTAPKKVIGTVQTENNFNKVTPKDAT